jgi:hypothetical protein
MSRIVLSYSLNSSLFYKNFCYSCKSTPKSLVFNAYFLRKYFLIQLLHYLQLLPIHMQKDFLMKIYTKLLQQSFKIAPAMPLSYHIETLRIAARLIGGKR